MRQAGSQAVGYRVASRMNYSISASNGVIRNSSSVRFRSLGGYDWGGWVCSTIMITTRVTAYSRGSTERRDAERVGI